MRWIGENSLSDSSLADITSVVAGTGLTGGATTGAATLNVIGGDGITANANDVAIIAAQTTITSIYNAGLKIGRDTDNLIDFATTDNKIYLRLNNANQFTIEDGAIVPVTTNDIDLGTAAREFKDAYFDGTVTSDAFAGPLTGAVTGNADTATLADEATILATARAINGVDFDGSGAITVTAAAGTLSGTTLKSSVVTSSLTTIGTIGAGVWRGTAIAQAYIANDAINGDKIADDAIDSEHYTDGSIDNAHIADNAIDSEHYADGSIDAAHIADDAVTFAKAVGVTPNVYGTTIKVLPSDFMANEEGGVSKTVQFVDNSASGLKAGNASTELLAFVSIPEGMKATLVDVYDNSHNLAVEVFDVDINSAGLTSKGTGNANTQIDITDVNATATNFLMIQVTTTALSERIFGALVTIAVQ